MVPVTQRALGGRALDFARRRWLLAVIVVITLFIAGSWRPVLRGDGVNYFVYLHALSVDHNINFTSGYAEAVQSGIPNDPSMVSLRSRNTGKLINLEPVGSSLLSLPFYLAALAIRPSGEPQYQPPFTTAFLLASLFYGLLGLALAYRAARKLQVSAQAAALGVAGAALGTGFLFYLLYEPSYSHTFSAFTSSLFLLLWWSTRERRSAWGWIGLGLLGGLMGTVRYQDAAFVAIPLLLDRGAISRRVLLVPGALAGLGPQLAINWSVSTQLGPELPPALTFDFWNGHYAEVLFSSQAGLLVWTPITVAAAVGLLYLRDRRLLVAAFLLIFGVDLILQGGNWAWLGGYTFGMRRFLNLTPFYVVGLAALAERLGWRLAGLGTVLAALWNLLLVANFIYVQRPFADPGYLGLLLGQLGAVAHLPHVLGGGAALSDLILSPMIRHQ